MDGGGAQPRNDTDVTESSGGAAAPPAPTNDPDVADSSGTAAAPPASASASSSSSAPSGAASKPQPSITLVHDGRFVQFNVSGNVFEITSKYTTPIRWLGKGAYGTVCKARNSEKDEMVAIKKIANAFSRISDGRRTLREIKILLRMKHENILEIRDIIPPAARETFNDVYIVYELMDCDLLQLIRSTQELSKQHKQYILYQILRGLKYIHSANVLHRDLTPANLLINSKNCHLKICDFGLARTSSETNFMTRDVVTIWYRAPELLLDSCQYTTAIDIWSVGCIYMEMINRAPLFQGNNQLKQLKLVLDFIGTPNEADLRFASEDARNLIRQRPPCARQSIAQKYPHVPREAVDLVEKMLTFDPEKRITAEKALEHPYLANLHVPNHGPDCTTPISFEFEKYVLSAGQLRKMIYEEALAFNPDYKI